MLVRPGAESLPGRVDDARVEFADPLPREPLPVHRAGTEVLDEDVAVLDQPASNICLPCSVLVLSVMLRLLQLSIVK